MTPADGAASAAVSTAKPPFKPLPQKGPDVSVERRADGSVLIWSNHKPGDGPRSIAHLILEKSRAHPERPWMKQREPGHGPWRQVTYGEAVRAAEGIAQWLLDRGLTGADSVMVLSSNSIEHALVMIGCYTAGVPVSPISPAYSLISSDHGKLKHCAGVVKPKVIFAQSGDMFQKAFDTLKAVNPALVFVTADGTGEGAVPLSELTGTEPTPAVETARETLNHATVAKYLFTSGSTGMPKGVPQTFGMMAATIAGGEGLRAEEADPRDVRDHDQEPLRGLADRIRLGADRLRHACRGHGTRPGAAEVVLQEPALHGLRRRDAEQRRQRAAAGSGDRRDRPADSADHHVRRHRDAGRDRHPLGDRDRRPRRPAGAGHDHQAVAERLEVRGPREGTDRHHRLSQRSREDRRRL